MDDLDVIRYGPLYIVGHDMEESLPLARNPIHVHRRKTMLRRLDHPARDIATPSLNTIAGKRFTQSVED